MDDEEHAPDVVISRTSTTEELDIPAPQSLRPSMVHFLSDEHFNWCEEAQKGKDEPGAPRKISSSSDVAKYLRADAFPGHRDTLARLPHLPQLHETDNKPIFTRSRTIESVESFTTARTRQPSVVVMSRRPSLGGHRVNNVTSSIPREILKHVFYYLSP
jgi:hypothetical protein